MRTAYYIAFCMMAVILLFGGSASADILLRNLSTDGASLDFPLYPSFLAVDTFNINTSGTITRFFPALRSCSNTTNIRLSLNIKGFNINFTPPPGTTYAEVNLSNRNIQFNASNSIAISMSQIGGIFHNCGIRRNVTVPPPYSYYIYYCPVKFDPTKQIFDPVTCSVQNILPASSSTYCKDNMTLVINETFTVCGASPVLNPNAQNCRDYARTREEVCAAGCDPKIGACTALPMERLAIVGGVIILVLGFIVYLARRYG